LLKQEIEQAKRTVTTDTVQITIGEMTNMYDAQELNILPEFQRLFRWSPDKKSGFIESILIGIPVPPIFVFEKEDGTWELIDGLQRISSILEFMGVLRDVSTGEPRRSALTRTKYLPSLENVVWNSANDAEKTLDKPLQLFFRRARLDFQILKHPSDPKTKFDLFQRLNRGGQYATEQEVRTCSMVLADSEFTRAVREFAETKEFLEMFSISQDQRENQTHVEYVVRLIVHSWQDLPSGMDVQDFLNHGILEIIERGKHFEVLNTVRQIVDLLQKALGEKALIPPEERADGIAQRFSLRALEGIAVGLARNADEISKLDDAPAFVRERVKTFWTRQEVVDMSASGLRGTVRIKRSVPFGQWWFDPNVAA
jgi:hypothetical protein